MFPSQRDQEQFWENSLISASHLHNRSISPTDKCWLQDRQTLRRLRSHFPEQLFTSLGRCLLEKPTKKAGAPDLLLYIGKDYPRWQPGEPRRIDLNQWRVPNLVGEISDTTLATDLDEKKHLYMSIAATYYYHRAQSFRLRFAIA